MPQKRPDLTNVESRFEGDLEVDLEGGEPTLTPPPDFTAREEIQQRAETVLASNREQTSSMVILASRTVKGERGRVAIVDGCRTPFAKSGTDLKNMDVVDLSGVAVAELIARNDFDPSQIDGA